MSDLRSAQNQTAGGMHPPAAASLDELAQRSIIPAELEPESPAAHRVGKGFITLFTLAYFGWFLIVMPPVIISIALKINTLVTPGERAGSLGLILGVGGMISLVLGPIFGKMSDRTTSRFGMRRPWLLGGLVFSVAGAGIIALAPSVGMVFVGFLVLALGGGVGAALAGVLPDQVPFSQRGIVSGLIGMSLPLGMVGGAFIVQLFATNMLLVFLVPTLIGAALIVLFALTLKDRKLDPADRPALSLREAAATFWVNPRRHPDYGWAWWSRFLIVLAYAFLTTYQTFYLIEKIGSNEADVPNQVFLGTLLLAGVSILSSVGGGKLSDVTGRRKVFVIVSALIYGAALVVAATATDVNGFLVAMTIAGVGFGAYSAVDIALVTDVLPSKKDAAKDMGVFNIASTLPQALAPAIAPIILSVAMGSYTVLFIVAGIIALVSAALILPVRKAR